MRIHRPLSKGALAILLIGIVSSDAGEVVAGPRSNLPSPPLTVESTTHVDANRIDMLLTNFGGFAHDFQGSGGPGFFYPAPTQMSAVYSAGLWVGAKVGNETRVTVSEYASEYQPGRITGGGWDDPADPTLYVYKIYKGDTQSYDYLHWPIGEGAPVDSAGHPAFLGDQTLWSVCNDANPARHTAPAGESAPLGIEVRQTTWAFHREGIPDNVIHLRFKILNKGTNTLTHTYVTCWVDPDVGGLSDDLVGCDTTLSLGFAYNATNADSVYGAEPPAVGFWLREGPIVPAPGDTATVEGHPVPGFRNLRLYSFNQYIRGATSDPDSARESYNYMEGLTRDGQPLVDPTTQYLTTFFYPGDPVTGTGWIDTTPGDKRMMITTGPFTMAPGDSQSVTFEIAAAQGTDRLASVTLLKDYVRSIDGPVPVLVTDLAADREDGAVVLRWSTSIDATGTTFTVYRAIDGGEREPVSGILHGGPDLTFTDRAAPEGDLLYWLLAAGSDGSATWFGPIRVAGPSRRLALELDGSNPFRSASSLRYALPGAGKVTITIRDLQGSVVRTLIDAIEPGGTHIATWDGRDAAGREAPAGVYLARLESRGATRTVKLTRTR